MKLFRHLLTTAAIAALMASSADAGTITALDLRGNGVFGHNANLVGTPTSPGNVAGDPLDWIITYTNLDIEGDGSANDTVNFTVRASGGTNQRAFNQGVDNGFGNLGAGANVGPTFSVINVSGTTTDNGETIIFDGFTGGAIGAGTGAGSVLDRNADVNGTNLSIFAADNGAFRFLTASVDFAPTPTITYDNSGGTSGSIVARNHDLQFSSVPSSIPEPSSLAVLGLAGLGLMARRRR